MSAMHAVPGSMHCRSLQHHRMPQVQMASTCFRSLLGHQPALFDATPPLKRRRFSLGAGAVAESQLIAWLDCPADKILVEEDGKEGRGRACQLKSFLKLPCLTKFVLEVRDVDQMQVSHVH